MGAVTENHTWRIGDDELSGSLLPAMPLAEAIMQARKAKPGAYVRKSMREQYAIFSRLFDNKNLPAVESAIEFIRRQMISFWLGSLTTITYEPKGNDIVTHYGAGNKPVARKVAVVGPDRLIQTEDGPFLEALLGEGDVQRVSAVFEWLAGKKTYLWRFNSKPAEKTERVAGFYVYSGRCELSCNGGPLDSVPALGYRK